MSHTYHLIDLTNLGNMHVVRFRRDMLVHESDEHELYADLRYVQNNLRPAPMLIDFESVEFINSRCLAVLFCFQEELEERGKTLTLCRLPIHIEDTLRMFFLDKVFAITDGAELPSDYIISHAFVA